MPWHRLVAILSKGAMIEVRCAVVWLIYVGNVGSLLYLPGTFHDTVAMPSTSRLLEFTYYKLFIFDIFLTVSLKPTARSV